MFLAQVVGPCVCPVQHEAYRGRKLLLVRPCSAANAADAARDARQAEAAAGDGQDYELAVDYVGAGAGDVVLVGGAPGVAREVFQVEKAPIRYLVMAIVDRVEVEPL